MYLGLDIAHNVTGFATLDDQCVVGEVGIVGMNVKKFDPSCTHKFGQWLDVLLEIGKITHIGAESMNVYTHPNSLRIMAYYHGVLHFLAGEHGIPLTYYNVSTWKAAFGIVDTAEIKKLPKEKRKEARKEQYVDVIEKHFGIQFDRARDTKRVGANKHKTYQDQAVALAIARCVHDDNCLRSEASAS